MSYMKRLLEDKIYVQVWLNESTDGMNFLRGFQQSHPMRMAAEYYTEFNHAEPATGLPIVLEQAFEQLNIDNPSASWAQEYRQRRNRSLSVGDVVVVGESAYACESVGWKPVTLTAEQCRR